MRIFSCFLCVELSPEDCPCLLICPVYIHAVYEYIQVNIFQNVLEKINKTVKVQVILKRVVNNFSKYYHLAGCTMFPHFPAPIDNYSIFFLQLLLSFQSSSINPFSPIGTVIPSAR
jgi:hypothetical protein